MPETQAQEQQRKRDDAAAVLLFGASDYLSAGYLWRKHAPRAYAGLLDNQSWRWDSQRQKYVSSSGKTLTDDHAKKLSILFALAMALEFEDEAAAAFNVVTTAKQWRETFISKLKSAFIVQGALGVGGLHRLTATDERAINGSVGNETGLAYSMSRADNFAKAIEDGKDSDGNPLKESAVRNRAGLYAATTNGIYEAARASSHIRAVDDKGRRLFLWQRNLLGPAEAHCVSNEFDDGCINVSNEGWQPIGVLPEIGTRVCAMNCRCNWEFALVPTKD